MSTAKVRVLVSPLATKDRDNTTRSGATMVGIKRTRLRQDSEDLDVESASSHLRHENNGVRLHRGIP